MPEPTGRGFRSLPPVGGPDAEIVGAITRAWTAHEGLRRPWLRQVEENVRMLSGQQGTDYIPELGAFLDVVDIARGGGDTRWREDPVFNRLKKYYDTHIAKLTENPPVLSAMPATPDDSDARLAELFDPIFRYEWQQMRVPQKFFWCIGWLLTAGRYVLYLRFDPSRGQRVRQPVLGPDGMPAIDPQTGQPQTGPAQAQGDLDLCIAVPTSVLWPAGPELIRDKPWVIHEYLLHVDEVTALYGIPIEPGRFGGGEDLLTTLGYGAPYGMPNQSVGYQGLGGKGPALEGMVKVRARWQRETETDPDGRWTVIAGDRVLQDGGNPYVVPGRQERVFLPYYAFDRLGYPWRQEGTTDLESGNPIQRAKNRRLGNMMDSADYNEQPIKVVNRAVMGDTPAEDFNRKGAVLDADSLSMGDPYWQATPPPLPTNSLQMNELLNTELLLSLNMDTSLEGLKLSDPSGELLRQDRFNTDRPLAANLRLHSWIWPDVAEDMIAIMAATFDTNRMLSMAGEDEAWTFVEVGPDLFTGSINIRPVLESAVLETPQDKQNRLYQAMQMGLLLPEQAAKVLPYGDLQKALRPGGEAWGLSMRENAEMYQTGVPADVWPEQRHEVHIMNHTDAMQGITFRRASPQVQMAFRFHLKLHQASLAATMVRDHALAASVVGAQATQSQDAMPAPPPGQEPSASGQGQTVAGGPRGKPALQVVR